MATLSGAFTMPVMAGPFLGHEDGLSLGSGDGPFPLDKKLNADWVKSLFARGAATTYQGWEQLRYIRVINKAYEKFNIDLEWKSLLFCGVMGALAP